MYSRFVPTSARMAARTAAMIVACAAASIGCDQDQPPQIVASIDRMVVFGDCDTGDSPGDFFFDLTLEEVVYPAPAPAVAAPRDYGLELSASDSPDPEYIALDVIEHALVQRSPSPDPVDVRHLRVSAPYSIDELLRIRATLSVYENDPAGPQWTAEESRPMTWYPEEECWKQYGDLGCVPDPGSTVWKGNLDLGREGDTCDVEIDWSIYVIE